MQRGLMSGSESMRRSTYAILAYFESVDMISDCILTFIFYLNHYLALMIRGSYTSVKLT